MNPIQFFGFKDKVKREGFGRSRGYPLKYYKMLFDPQKRDPRGYILPSNQPDFLTATKFVNTLFKNGIIVYRATRSFEVAGKAFRLRPLKPMSEKASFFYTDLKSHSVLNPTGPSNFSSTEFTMGVRLQ